MSKQIIGLFSFDGPLYRDKNGKYCSTTLTDEMFSRFFTVVEKIVVLVRVFDEAKSCEELNMKELHVDKLEIIGTENLVTPKGITVYKGRLEKKLYTILGNVDLVFARMPSLISDSVCKVCLELNKPYLVEVGGCAWDSYWNHGITGKAAAPLVYYWQKKYVANASFATYVTKEFLQRRYPNSNINTNCSNVYLQQVEQTVLQKRLDKIDSTDLRNIKVGQVVASVDVKYKGEHYFVQVMSELKKMGIRITYEIVGPGSGSFILEQAEKYGVAEQVILTGAKKKEEVFEWLNSIDLYVQPSKQEGLPRSVIEAMSVGCPSVGSKIAGIPELLDEDCLFNPDNIQQFTNVVIQLLEKNKMKTKAKTNFERAKEYNLADIEQRRKKIFEEYSRYISDKK